MVRKIYGTIFSVDEEDVKTKVAEYENASAKVAILTNDKLENGQYVVEETEEIVKNDREGKVFSKAVSVSTFQVTKA